ncbi:MAG: SPFH domain-containing protein [Thermoplasmata archaeon]|nr:SPFH domain-containing protein [Thermoplasmata archaeon]
MGASAIFLVAPLIVIFLAVALVARMTKIIKPYENGVVTLFGSYKRTLFPGLSFVSLFAHLIRVDMRPRSESVGPLYATAADLAPIAATARLEYRVVDARKACFGTPDLPKAVAEAVKNSVTSALASPGALASGGMRLSEDTRQATSGELDRLGVEVGELVLDLQSSTSRTEHRSGRRFG